MHCSRLGGLQHQALSDGLVDLLSLVVMMIYCVFYGIIRKSERKLIELLTTSYLSLLDRGRGGLLNCAIFRLIRRITLVWYL